MNTGDRLLRVLFVLIWVIAIVQVLAEQYYWYWTYRWLDILMHFLGGVWVGLGAIWLVHFAREHANILQKLRPFVLAVLAGVVVGFVWEGYEYGVWVWTDTLPPNHVPDSLLDLVMDVLGAIAGYGLYRWWFDPQSDGKVNEKTG